MNNYRDFFKNKKTTVKDIKNLIPEGVSKNEFKKGLAIENRNVHDIFTAAKIASRNLMEDVNYYSKINENGGDCTCGAQDGAEHRPHSEDCGVYNEGLETDFNGAEDCEAGCDDNGGLPKVGGALAVPHIGQPIMMGKIIQVGGEFKDGQPASGEQSGMTNVKGVAKDQGGLPVQQQNDKEHITAGGKKVDGSIASKSVGGNVVPGEGQSQGGPNHQGTIASTSKLTESKNKVRKIVKQVLKEIKFDKQSGKWVKINEEQVKMTMGKSYKTVQPRQYKVMDDDVARTNQYEPDISEMFDQEEETKLNERYVELANASRNLNETELSELKTIREKMDSLQAKRNFGVSPGGIESNLYEKGDKWIQKAVNPAHKGDCTPMSKPSCTPARKAFAMRAKHHDLQENEMEHPDDARERHEFERGIDRNNRRNPQRYECPTCKRPNALSHDQKQKGYQCNACADAEEGAFQETVDMKMGPAYKTVQPTLAKTSNDDFARRNQFEPELSEDGERSDFEIASTESHPNDYKKCKECGQQNYMCSCLSKHGEEGDFGHDGFPAQKLSERGGAAEQHSSYRTIKNGNLPQDSKTRWKGDVDEGKVSKVVKTIVKGQKGNKSTFHQSLKHQKPKKTTSGVHKRKT